MALRLRLCRLRLRLLGAALVEGVHQLLQVLDLLLEVTPRQLGGDLCPLVRRHLQLPAVALDVRHHLEGGLCFLRCTHAAACTTARTR